MTYCFNIDIILGIDITLYKVGLYSLYYMLM